MHAATPPELSVKRWHWWHWWRLRFGLFSGVRVGLFLGLFSGLVVGLFLAGTVPAMAQEDRLDFARGEIALVGINAGTKDDTNDGTKDGAKDARVVIAVEFARNKAERRQGLMRGEIRGSPTECSMHTGGRLKKLPATKNNERRYI